MATGEKKIDVNIVAAFAPQVVADAILSAVRSAAHSDFLPASSIYTEGERT
jgi:hypothetical protein